MAGHLGKTVREIEETVDALELREWEDFFQLSREGKEGGGLEAAIAAAIPAR